MLLSATQINLFRECPRKWGFSYVLGLKTPETPAMTLGKDVDDGQLQPYLTKGRPFDRSDARWSRAADIAQTALPYLPEPLSKGLECQKHFVLTSFSGLFAYHGYIDLWYPDGPFPVIDFKTTKALRYLKTSDVLKTDVQAQLYATWAFSELNRDEIPIRWVTMLTDGSLRCKPSDLVVSISHVEKQFEEIEQTGNQIHGARVSTPAAADLLPYVLSLEPNYNACETYGGCPYRHQCNTAPAQYRESTLVNLRKKNTMTMSANDALARLKARKQAASAPAATTPAATTPAAITPAATTPEVPELPIPAAMVGLPTLKQAPAFAGINPPEKSLPPAPATGAAIGAEEDTAEQTEAAAVAATTPRRGRKKAEKDPLGADFAMHAGIDAQKLKSSLEAFATALSDAAAAIRSIAHAAGKVAQ